MKFKKIFLLIFVLFGLVISFTIFQYKKSQNSRINITSVETDSKNITKPTEANILKYLVKINGVPAHKSLGFTYDATITNISVEPYITNFSLYECNFIDYKNNKYSGSLMDNNVFSKAIKINESINFIAKDVNVTIPGVDNMADGLRKCFYDKNSDKVCEYIKGLKLVDCKGYISTNSKNSSNGWGEYPIEIQFPN